MIPRSLVRARMFKGAIKPAFLPADDPAIQDLARALRAAFAGSVGGRRAELDDRIEESLALSTDVLVGRGLAHLLEQRSTFETSPDADPPAVREALFTAAARARAAGTFDRTELVARVAGARGLAVRELEDQLFCDLESEQRLVAFDDLGEERLVERYNVALAQSLLLDARRLSVEVRDTPARIRRILRAMKFQRLLCEVSRTAGGGVRLEIDGPLSLFEQVRSYGVQLASFLPAVLLARDFAVEATVAWKGRDRVATLAITNATGLASPTDDGGAALPEEHAAFAARFESLGSAWRVAPAEELVPLGDGALAVPDWTFTPPDGSLPVHLEVLGRWRKASAERHLERLAAARLDRYLVAIAARSRVSDAHEVAGADVRARVPLIEFGQVMAPRKVLEALEALLGG